MAMPTEALARDVFTRFKGEKVNKDQKLADEMRQIPLQLSLFLSLSLSHPLSLPALSLPPSLPPSISISSSPLAAAAVHHHLRAGSTSLALMRHLCVSHLLDNSCVRLLLLASQALRKLRKEYNYKKGGRTQGRVGKRAVGTEGESEKEIAKGCKRKPERENEYVRANSSERIREGARHRTCAKEEGCARERRKESHR
eukprot:3941055-Pleurochrysis_carterae.AAC.3